MTACVVVACKGIKILKIYTTVFGRYKLYLQ